MFTVQRLTQAYRQTPWRQQMQLIGLFLLVLILGALVAGIYLSVTARAATIGRNIQLVRADMETVQRELEDLETQLAVMTSNTEMEKRAEDLGFRPMAPGEAVFLTVPGYAPPGTPNLAQEHRPVVVESAALPEDYTQSLFDWLRERVFEPAAPLAREKP
jgi:hypothetical protein